MLITSIVIAFLLSIAGQQTNSCNDFAYKELLKSPPESRYEYRGRYENWSYQYTVTIPKGVTAYGGRAEPNHQGFGIAVGASPQSFIFVRGEPNNADFNAPHEAATESLKFLRQDGKKIEAEIISASHLGTLKAVHFKVTYSCPGSANRYTLSSVKALSADKRFLYTLEIYSPANRFESDRAVLDQIIKSWKVLVRSRRQKR